MSDGRVPTRLRSTSRFEELEAVLAAYRQRTEDAETMLARVEQGGERMYRRGYEAGYTAGRNRADAYPDGAPCGRPRQKLRDEAQRSGGPDE